MTRKHKIPIADIIYEENGEFYTLLASWVLGNPVDQSVLVKNGVIIAREDRTPLEALEELANQAYPDFDIIDVQYIKLSEQFGKFAEDLGDDLLAGYVLSKFDENVDKQDGGK